jgi:hypothetical protein
MNAFGLLLYLLIFLIPVGPGTLCDYLWQRSPEWMIALTLHSKSGIIFNGGFYVLMLASWFFFSLAGKILASALEKDDANWRTVFGHYESSGKSVVWDLGLLLFGTLCFVWLLFNHMQLYGMVALSLPVVFTLGNGLLRGLLRGNGRVALKSKKVDSESRHPQNTDDQDREWDLPQLKAPRSLTDEEPKPLFLS